MIQRKMNRTPPDLSSALAVDARLTEIERELNLLLNVTPTNGAEAWTDFERSGFESVPTLQSRPLGFDPDLVKRDLYNAEIERVEDPALNSLFRAKRDEIARQITLLEDRGTSRFRYGALQLYGEPGESLIATARSLLARIDPQPITASSITATAFAEAARTELESYRSRYPGFPVAVEVRDDVADLMVSFGRLFIPATAAFREDRVEPLIQHEVGTHVLTYRNGDSQPLTLLAVGLPSYEETQEGLAVLAEYVVGGLDPRRMRVLAARVVAASMMLANADFIEIFKHLTDDHGFAPRTAWSVTSRATYGGGSTKDIIYLRGTERVLGYFAEGRGIDPLLAGKLSLDHAPLVEDLIQQGVLEPPWARPRWLSAPGAEERLERVRRRHERRRPTRDGRGRMRIAFLVNRVETEIDEYATTRLAKAAALMGHEVWYIGLGDLRIGEPDGEIGAHARPGIARDDDTLTAFVDRMKESSAERIRLDKLDAVFLRNDSIEDLQDRPWASSLGAVFGELLVAHGVTVVNDPTVLRARGDEGVSRRIPGGDQAPIPDDAQRGGRPELHLVRGPLHHQTAVRREGPQRVHGRRRGRAQPEPDHGGGSRGRLHLRAGIRRRRRGRRHADLPARRRAHRGRRTRLRVPAGAGRETTRVPTSARAAGCNPETSPRRRARWSRRCATSSFRTGCSSSAST